MTLTPSRAAGLTEVDTTEPRVRASIAIGVIMAGYLMFFGTSVITAINIEWNDIVLRSTDYSSFGGFYEFCRRLIGIGGAVLVLYLCCQWLRIPRALAGVPKYPAPPQPALATVVIAIAALIAASVLRALIEPGPDADPNASAGGVAPNPWALLSLASDLNAGVVEEIILVAVPVLVGRRAGWHPAWILGLAMVLRWPFHIYQGVWTTLPWAMVWGGAFAAAFLYLRRLWPLVAVHFLTDAQIDMASAYGGTGRLVVILVGFGCVAFLVWRSVVHQREQLNPDVPTLGEDPAARKYLHEHRTRTEKVTGVILGVLLVGTLGLVFVSLLIDVDLWTALGVTVCLSVVCYAAWWVVLSAYNATNVIVRRDEDGRITGVVRWHTSYTRTSTLDTFTDGLDIFDTVGEIARLDNQPVVISSGDKKLKARFAALGLYPTSGRHPFRRIHVPAERARQLSASTTGRSAAEE